MDPLLERFWKQDRSFVVIVAGTLRIAKELLNEMTTRATKEGCGWSIKNNVLHVRGWSFRFLSVGQQSGVMGMHGITVYHHESCGSRRINGMHPSMEP